MLAVEKICLLNLDILKIKINIIYIQIVKPFRGHCNLGVPEKPLKHLDFEVKNGFLGWQNSQGLTWNLAKSWQNMTQTHGCLA